MNTESGFYDIGSSDDVVITPYSSNSVAEDVTQDIDGDGNNDAFYPNSIKLDVKYSAATSGNFYGIILVEGTGIPTIDNQIHYIDQVDATSSEIDFIVYPTLPEEGTEMTLYISSSEDGAELISIPVKYAVEVTVDEQNPDPGPGPSPDPGPGPDPGPSPEQVLGDMDGNGVVDINDAVLLFNHSMISDLYPIDYVGNKDLNKDGAIDINDAVLLFNYSMLPDLYPIE